MATHPTLSTSLSIEDLLMFYGLHKVRAPGSASPRVRAFMAAVPRILTVCVVWRLRVHASKEPGSACEGALRVGDLILSIDGKQPRDPAHLREICPGPPGTIVAPK